MVSIVSDTSGGVIVGVSGYSKQFENVAVIGYDVPLWKVPVVNDTSSA